MPKRVQQDIILLTEKCNQNCVFCSGSERFAGQGILSLTDKKIRETINQIDKSVCFEGGEPTLSDRLLKYVALAKNKGIKDIILVTNGVRLAYKDYCQKLIDNGITLFSVSFPHSNEKISDAITRSPGTFKLRFQGIRNLIELGAGQKTRLTFVVSRLNYNDLLNFAKFIKKNFEQIFYIEINYVKVLGQVKKRPQLLIPLAKILPHLKKAMGYCRRQKIMFILDGFPLCLIPGYEGHNIDTYFFIKKINNQFLPEKIKPVKCQSCSLAAICSGLRRDYFDIFGDNELKPSRKNPDVIIQKIIRQQKKK